MKNKILLLSIHLRNVLITIQRDFWTVELYSGYFCNVFTETFCGYFRLTIHMKREGLFSHKECNKIKTLAALACSISYSIFCNTYSAVQFNNREIIWNSLFSKKKKKKRIDNISKWKIMAQTVLPVLLKIEYLIIHALLLTDLIVLMF